MTRFVVISTLNSGARLLDTLQAACAAWRPVWVVVDGSTDAPALRVGGRRLSNWCAQLETGWAGIEDSLFGFRVYPVGRLLPIMERSSRMRGFFDLEAVVRLSWDGVPAVNLPAPGALSPADEGGASHFRYGRDNLLLAAMQARLGCGCGGPAVVYGVTRGSNAPNPAALAPCKQGATT